MYGIDFGTSNTVLTAREGGRTRLLDLGEGGVVPSLLYFERDRRASVGHAAASDYAAALERWKGERDLYERFRFFQALKLALKDPLYEGTTVFGERFKPEALAGIFLRELKRRADAACGTEAEEVVLGRPVTLASDGAEDARLEGRFRAAAELAGFSKVAFVPEPVGAATSLLGRHSGIVLVFDFGGGTLDVTVARMGTDSIEPLANAGIDLGGYLLDEDLSRARVIRHFGSEGKIRTMKGSWLDMPSWFTKQVASFHALPLADLARTRMSIREVLAEVRPIDKPKLRGLLDFIDRNLGFRLFERIDEAKIRLSSEDAAEIAFEVPPHVSFRERVGLAEFEALAAPRVEAARALVLSALAKAGLEAGEVGKVVRVGGSCRIPAFIRMLDSLFPGRVEEGEVFTSIAAGLLEAHERGLSC
ncbi:MAG TPA: Hsp70 family protein [Spirochaetales bacterium]|nr:Hsp70 family protein [Spirochaetales bacterium]